MGVTSPAGGQTVGQEEDRPVGGSPPGEALIDIRGVKLTYETKGGRLPVLDGVEMQVPEGGFAAVVGPSGCGKSTLTRLIAGLLEPDAGEVWLHGQRVTGPKSSVGMAFQNPVLLEWRSVLRNVTLPLELVARGCPGARRKRAHGSFWPSSASRASRTSGRASFRAACASVRRFAAHSSTSRKC